MAFPDWDSDKMLALYIHDHMLKRNMHEAADIFAKEANLELKGPVRDDAPDGFLSEWWEIFWSIYCSTNANLPKPNSESSSATVEDQLHNTCPVLPTTVMNQHGAGTSRQIVETKLPNPCPVVAPPGPNQLIFGSFPVNTGFGCMLGHPAGSLLSIPGMGPQWPNNSQEIMMKHAIKDMYPQEPTLGMNRHRDDIFPNSTNFGNMVGAAPASLLPIPGINQHRVGKRPMDTNSDNMLGQPTAESSLTGKMFEERLGSCPVELDPVSRLFEADYRSRMMLSSTNASHLQQQASSQSPLSVARDNWQDIAIERSTEMDPTLLAGPSSLSPTT